MITFKEYLAEEAVDYLDKSNITALKNELKKTLGLTNNGLYMSFRGYRPLGGKDFDQIFVTITVPKREMSDPDMFFSMAKIAVDECMKKYFPNPKFGYDQVIEDTTPQIIINYIVQRNS